MTPFRTTLALLLLVAAVLLVAGCGSCPQPLQNVTIIKLDSHGTLLWTKTLDQGISNGFADLVPTPDGGFVVTSSISTTHAGCTLNHQGRLIRFSSSGEILWDRVFNTGEGLPSKIIQMRDGGFATLFDKSKIYRLDSNGKTLWTSNLGSVSPYVRGPVISETGSGGLIVAGPIFVKLDPTGKILWQRSINERGKDVFFVNEIKNGQEYLVFSRSTGESNVLLVMKFDSEGIFINSSEFSMKENLFGWEMFSEPDNYRLLYYEEKLGPSLMQFNPDGTLIQMQKINSSEHITLTNDQGYFYAKKALNTIQTVKQNLNGTENWNNTISNNYENNLNIYRVLQTNDYGYVIVSLSHIQKDIASL